jgi:predicted TIM-barrel fold metal-dependent hydrolase
VLNIQGIPQALGISIDSYFRIQEEIFSCAHELNLPLLYHINLSQYYDWIATLLKKFPLLTVNIPHLGYSLRRVAEILDQFENTYTDPSYLISLLKKNNRRYLSFISTYDRKILSGSDAIITGSPEDITAYPRYFDSLGLPDASTDRILRKNARRFLSLPA